MPLGEDYKFLKTKIILDKAEMIGLNELRVSITINIRHIKAVHFSVPIKSGGGYIWFLLGESSEHASDDGVIHKFTFIDKQLDEVSAIKDTIDKLMSECNSMALGTTSISQADEIRKFK